MGIKLIRKKNETASNKATILNAIRDALKPFGDFKINADTEDQYDDGGVQVTILDYDGIPVDWISKEASRKGADYLCTAIEKALKTALEKYGCEVSTDGEGDMVLAYIETPEEDESRKREGLRDLKTFKKDLVYVPEFTNEAGLNDVVQDIHAQYKNGEDGWEGDAQSFSSIQRVMELTDFPYLIAIGDSDTLFAFQSKSDRDCILMDYLRDPDLLG